MTATSRIIEVGLRWLDTHRKLLAWITLIVSGAAKISLVLCLLLSTNNRFVIDATKNVVIVYSVAAIVFIASARSWKRAWPLIKAASII